MSQKNNKRQQVQHHSKYQFGLFQASYLSYQHLCISIQDQTNHWKIKIELNKNALEIERNKLAEILLANDTITKILNKRTKSQAYLQDCIQNPANHTELKPGDVEKYIELLPQNEQILTVFNNQLIARNAEQQACELNIIRLENKIARLEDKIENYQRIATIFSNPNALFNNQRTNNRLQKPHINSDTGTRLDLSPKRQF